MTVAETMFSFKKFISIGTALQCHGYVKGVGKNVVAKMNETMKQWVKPSGKKCKDCGRELMEIEAAYCENLHTCDYRCINCLSKKYYLMPKLHEDD